MPLTPEERRKKKAANKIKANTIDIGVPRVYKDSPNPTHRGNPVELHRPV